MESGRLDLRIAIFRTNLGNRIGTNDKTCDVSYITRDVTRGEYILVIRYSTTSFRLIVKHKVEKTID